MPIYFLRHGESEANVALLFAGQKEDSPLTDLGKRQAHIAGQKLAPENVSRIISSPLQRARQTAGIVALELGIENVSIDDRIQEYDMGSLTGSPHRKITSLELVSADGAENSTAFKDRVLEALREYSKSNENILLVSHAGVGRIIEAARLDIDTDTFYDLDPYPNAEAIILDLAWLNS